MGRGNEKVVGLGKEAYGFTREWKGISCRLGIWQSRNNVLLIEIFWTIPLAMSAEKSMPLCSSC